MKISLLLLLFAVLASGCIASSPAGGGLFVSVTPDPPVVFSSGILRINIDIDNKNPRTVADVSAQVFDTGILSGNTCQQQISFMRPDEFKTFSCILQAPQREALVQNQVKTSVGTRVSYTADLSAAQIVEMMTENEYLQRTQSGRLQARPSSYVYTDKNVEIDVEFSDAMPIIVRPDVQKDYFVYFTIKNTGNGFIENLKYGDFILAPVRPDEPNIVICPDLNSPSWKLEPEGKKFPRIACRLALPSGVSVVENYGLVVLLKYRYEIRENTVVTVIK